MRDTIELLTQSGKQISCFPGDEITIKIQKHGEYDQNALAFMRDVLNRIKPHHSIDVGANIGLHALTISEYSSIVSVFEPVPFVFDVLQQNILKNNASNITAYNLALSDKSGKSKIYLSDDSNLGNSSIENISPESEAIEIIVERGDEILNLDDSIDFIKIDVEGHEVHVFNGLENVITRDKPLILMEWNSVTVAEMFEALNLFETLFQGYTVYALSSKANKKCHPRTVTGFLRRLLNKMTGNKWCLTSFNPNNKYSNILLVPPKHASLFQQLPYLANS